MSEPSPLRREAALREAAIYALALCTEFERLAAALRMIGGRAPVSLETAVDRVASALREAGYLSSDQISRAYKDGRREP